MSHLTPEQWNDLCEAILNHECVLLLGPKITNKKGEFLQDLFAKKFAEKLGLLDNKEHSLPNLIKLYEISRQRSLLQKNADKILKDMDCNDSASPTLEKTSEVLDSFYKEILADDIPVYKMVADLRFSCIITTTPDDLLKKVLKDNKLNPHCFFFHFDDASHNNSITNDKALNLYKNSKRPLLYNLMGNYEAFNSLVITDDDRLKFVEKVLQRDKHSVPINIAIHFADPEIKHYLFIGFDFNDWHLRLLMHFFRLDPRLSQKDNNDSRPQNNMIARNNFALQPISELSKDKAIFYSRYFDMTFVDELSETFLSELKQQLEKRKEEKKASKPETATLQLLFLYHEKDTPLREEVEKHLAALRIQGLEIWYEGKMELGSHADQTIAKHLQTAHIIVPLITVNFMASDKLYEQYLQTALERYQNGAAKVVSILMSPCDLKNTFFADNENILLPTPRNEAISQKLDREKALVVIAQYLRETIENFNKSSKIPSL